MSISDEILKAIEIAIDKKMKDLTKDTIYTGIITSVNSANDFGVSYDRAVRRIKTKNSPSLVEGNIVHVVYPQGSEENKYILEDNPYTTASDVKSIVLQMKRKGEI